MTARLSRRNALSAGAFTALAGIVSAALAKPDEGLTADDRALIAIGQEAAPLLAVRNDLTRNWWAITTKGTDRSQTENAELQRIWDALDGPDNRLDEMLDQAMELKASSAEALRAKALLVRHHMSVDYTEGGNLVFPGSTEELAWSLLSDLIGEVV